MDVQAAKMIGAGLAALALGGAGIGIGNIFGNYLAGALRNPAAAKSQTGTLFLGFALAEATGIIAFALAAYMAFS
jgi:F-type H+-transporting ATPase subunit c